MKKTLLVALILSALATAPAFADWSQKDAEDLMKKAQANQGIWKEGVYGKSQIISLIVGGNKKYTIDLRAKLCFIEANSISTVPCAALKEGYPIIAPLISWEK